MTFWDIFLYSAVPDDYLETKSHVKKQEAAWKNSGEILLCSELWVRLEDLNASCWIQDRSAWSGKAIQSIHCASPKSRQTAYRSEFKEAKWTHRNYRWVSPMALDVSGIHGFSYSFCTWKNWVIFLNAMKVLRFWRHKKSYGNKNVCLCMLFINIDTSKPCNHSQSSQQDVLLTHMVSHIHISQHTSSLLHATGPHPGL